MAILNFMPLLIWLIGWNWLVSWDEKWRVNSHIWIDKVNIFTLVMFIIGSVLFLGIGIYFTIEKI